MRDAQSRSRARRVAALLVIMGLCAPSGTALAAVASKPSASRHHRKASHSKKKKNKKKKKGAEHKQTEGEGTNETTVSDPLSSPELWATVDVCNAADQPDTIGIRGSMPGDGDQKDQMYMRFQVQYLQITTHAWMDLSSGGESTWVKLGSASAVRQAGQTFQFVPNPGETANFTLRGLVSFQWRREQKVIYSATRITSAGHQSLAGADPAGFSAATCPIP